MKKTFFYNYLSALLLAFFLIIGFQGNAQFATDLGISDIVTPQTDCDIENDTVSVTLINYGMLPQSLIPFRFSINGEEAAITQPLDGYYTGVLGPDSTVTLSFETTYDFSEDGFYEIMAWTEVESDMDTSNDTLFMRVENIPLVESSPYTNIFAEAYPSGWYPDVANNLNSSWVYGIPENIVIDTAYTQEYNYVTNPIGNYNSNETSYILSPCMDFSNFSSDPVFRSAFLYETENNYDAAWLEGSIDGGITWAKIGAMGAGTNWYNVDDTFTNLGECWNGTSDGWLEIESVMEGYAGEADVQLRFAFDSDGSVQREGIAFDDVSITGCLNSFNVVFDVVNATTTTAADGLVTIASSEGVAPFTYTWDNGETSDAIADLPAGEYALTIVDALGCVDEVTVEVGIGVVAVTDIDKEVAVRLYPNPSDGYSLLELDFAKQTTFSVSVINSLGRRVLEFSDENISAGKYPLDIRHLSAGIYFVQINVPGAGSKVEKLLVQ